MDHEALLAEGKAAGVRIKELLAEAERLAGRRRDIAKQLRMEGVLLREIAQAFELAVSRVSHLVNDRKKCRPHQTANCRRCKDKKEGMLTVTEDEMYALHTGDYLPRFGTEKSKLRKRPRMQAGKPI